MQKLISRYPLGMPAFGLFLSALASIDLLIRDSENGILLGLLAASGAVLNAFVLLGRLAKKRN
ncbi:MAG: hypothetical protein V4713_03595 [Pseudomonadota bacterium]